MNTPVRSRQHDSRGVGHASTLRCFACALLAFLVAMVIGACDRPVANEPATPGNPPNRQQLVVIATTGMIADVASNIAGPSAKVTALMGEGIDPHLYKASPSDLRLLQRADLILYNGLHLEGKLAEVLENLSKSRRAVAVTDRFPAESLLRPSEFQGHPDPHVWFDVALWSLAAERIREALSDADPSNADVYRSRAESYRRELADLDGWCKAELTKVPEHARVLVTAHDAFGYFGRAYGLSVRGIQGISTDSEASIRDINALVDTLVNQKIPAVFIESSVPRKTIDALVEGCTSRGHRMIIGGELYSDAMGAAGTPDGTYIGMIRHNVRTIVNALNPAPATVPVAVPKDPAK